MVLNISYVPNFKTLSATDFFMDHLYTQSLPFINKNTYKTLKHSVSVEVVAESKNQM